MTYNTILTYRLISEDYNDTIEIHNKTINEVENIWDEYCNIRRNTKNSFYDFKEHLQSLGISWSTAVCLKKETLS